MRPKLRLILCSGRCCVAKLAGGPRQPLPLVAAIIGGLSSAGGAAIGAACLCLAFPATCWLIHVQPPCVLHRALLLALLRAVACKPRAADAQSFRRPRSWLVAAPGPPTCRQVASKSAEFSTSAGLRIPISRQMIIDAAYDPAAQRCSQPRTRAGSQLKLALPDGHGKGCTHLCCGSPCRNMRALR